MGEAHHINMRIALCITLVLVAVYAAPSSELSDSEYKSLFAKFQTVHSASYVSEDHASSKFAVFKDNVDFINDHNQNHADRLGYTVAINQFAELTANTLDESSTPASIDWTTKGAVTAVKNQGSCGSCWAFSTTGAIEGRNYIANGNLVSLSEQELVSCASSYGNQGCNGGLMDDGFKFVEASGLETESSYSYDGATATCSTSKEGTHNGIAPGVVTGFKDVTSNSESQLAAAVAQGPVSVAIEADQSGFQFYKSGVFSGTCGTALDHGVLAVGYGTDSGTAYWKVKNSWGQHG